MRSNLFFRSMWINSSEKKCTFTFNWEKNATMINTLTSLRLFFALMVFGAHCYVVDSTFSTHFYKEGFVGVSFFFILSGFIIAYNYQQKLGGAESVETPVLGGT